MITDAGSTLETASSHGHDITPGTLTITEITKGVVSAEAYTIPNLLNGVRYHVRVAASNDVGYGPWTTTTIRNGGGMPSSLNFPCVNAPCPLAPLRAGGMVPIVAAVRQAPSAPVVTGTMISQSQAQVAWQPSSSNGDEVDKYKIEWFTSSGTSEVKVIKLNNTNPNDRRSAPDTSGSWTLTLNGETTARIAHDASAVEVKARVENLVSITQVDVARTLTEEPVTFGYIWAITFTQDIGDIADATLNINDLHSETGNLEFTIVQDGTGASVVGTPAADFGSYEMNNHQESCSQTTDQGETGQCAQGNREIQTIVTEAASVMSGTFGLTFRGKRTSELAVESTAAQVRAALLALSSISDVEVTRSTTISNGYRWYVTFLTSDGPVDRLVVDGAFLGGQDAIINNYETAFITTSKEQDATHSIKGTFKIHIGSERTSALAFDCTESAMETALLLFNSVARIDVTRTGATDQFEWVLMFKQHDANLNMLRVVPQSDFLGIGAMLNVKRPRGSTRYNFLVGNRHEIQTLDLQATTSAVTAGSFKLEMLDTTGTTLSTACINWGAEAMGATGTVQYELEQLASVDKVSVSRSGDGSSLSDYGYSYTVTFYGTVGSDNVNELSVSNLGTGTGGCTAFTGGANHEALTDTKFGSSALANANHQYVALKSSSTYTIRVSAQNDQGYGYSSAYTAVTTLNGELPTRPLSLARRTYTDTSFHLHYDAPLHNGGSEITKYRVEIDTSSSFSSVNYRTADIAVVREVQSITTTFSRAALRGGSFNLLWGRKRTTDLDWDATSDAVARALQKITGAYNEAINPVEVSRTALDNGYHWLVTFNGMRGNVGALTANDDYLTGYNPKVLIDEITTGSGDITPGDFTYETQAISTEGLSDLGGTFTLEFEGYTTGTIAFSASAAVMKSSLEALATIHTVNVVKTQTNAVAGDVGGVTWEVSFTHKVHERIQAAGNIGLLLADFSSLSGTEATVHVTELLQGTDPFKYEVSGLTVGVSNYVRIFAYNSLGYGPYSDVLSVTPMSSPSAPTMASLSVNSKTSLTTTWSPPVSTNGAPVTEYNVEWYKEEPAVEVQMVTTSSNGHIEEIQMIETAADTDSISNWFTVSFKGEKTAPMFEDVSAADLKAALERLSTIGTVSVTSDRTNDGYSQRAITGKIDAANGANAITCNSGAICAFTTDFSRGDLVWVAGETFRVHLSNTFDATTVPLATVADNSVAATFAGASVSGITSYKWAFGHVWKVTFNSGHVGNQEPLVAEPATGWTGVDVTLNVFTLREGLQPISGYFTLAFESAAGVVPTTKPIAHDASALVVKNALENLVTVGSIDVSRAKNGFGYSWMITFQTNLGPVNSLVAVGTELTGPQASISVSKSSVGIVASGYGSQIITDLTQLTYTISGLTTGTTYLVRIAAANSEGYGSVILTSPLSEVPRETPAATTGVSLITLSSTMLKVIWNPPADGTLSGGALITKYKIDWDTDSSFGSVETSGYTHEFSDVTGVTLPYFYNIPVTTQGVSYFVRVSAYNDMGYGPSTKTPTATTPVDSVPSAVYSATLTVVSDAELRIDWIAPRTDINSYGGNGGRPITQYMIEWDTDFSNPPSPAFKVITDTSLASYTIGSRNPLTGERGTTLIAGEAYYVRIAAYNNLGNGIATLTTPNFATTANQIPIATTNLALAVNTATALQSSWSQPDSDGGLTFQTAKVEWDTKSTFDSKQTVAVSATSSISSGSFKLSYGSAATAPLTSCIAWNAMASTVEAQIESMTGIYDVVVTRQGDATPAFSNGYTWTVTFINPVAPANTLQMWADQSACALFTCSGSCGAGERISTGTTSLGYQDIDYVAEKQILSQKQIVQHEIQLVTDTVAVTHERQTITTILPNARDEIQTVTTDCATVISEVQTITTDTADVDEVQLVSLSALDVDEKQQIRTSIEHVDEVQAVKVTGVDRNEIQTLTITETLKTQEIHLGHTHVGMSVSQVAVTAAGTSAVATYTFTLAGTVSVGDMVLIAGAAEGNLNKFWTITAVGSGTFTFKAIEHGFTTDGTYNAGSITAVIEAGAATTQSVQVTSVVFTNDGGGAHSFIVNHHDAGIHKFTAGKTVTISGMADTYFNQDWVIETVTNTGVFVVGDGVAVMTGATASPPVSSTITLASGLTGIQVSRTYTYSSAFMLRYFDVEFCVPHYITVAGFYSVFVNNVGPVVSQGDVTATTQGFLNANTRLVTVKIDKATETVNIQNIDTVGNMATINLVTSSVTVNANPGLIRVGDTISISGIDQPSAGSVLNGAFTVVTVSADGLAITYDLTQNSGVAPGDATYSAASPFATLTTTLVGRPVAMVVSSQTCTTTPNNQHGVTSSVRGILADHDLAPVNDIGAVTVSIDATSIAGDFTVSADFTDSNCLNCVTSSRTSATSAQIPISNRVIPSAQAVQDAINAMANMRQSFGVITVNIAGNTATASHSDSGYVYARAGETVTVSGFTAGNTALNANWLVTGTPTRWSFDFDVTSLSGGLSGSIGAGAATVDNAVTVSRVLHPQPAEGATYTIEFTGKQVSGNVPTMLVATNSIVGDAKDCAVSSVPKVCALLVQTTAGHQVDGTFFLTFDDTTVENNPVGSNGPATSLAIPSRLCATSTDVDCSTLEQTTFGADSVTMKINALANVGVVKVIRTPNYDGVGGYTYSVTFTSDHGNRALMNCTGSDYVMGIIDAVSDSSDVVTVNHYDVGAIVVAAGDYVTISGMTNANLNGYFEVVGTPTRQSFTYKIASAGAAGSATHAADTYLHTVRYNGGDSYKTITGTSGTSSCEVSTPAVTISQIVYDHTTDVATVTHNDATGYKIFHTGDKIMITGASYTWANTGWTITSVMSTTTFTFSAVEFTRAAPNVATQTYTGAASAHQQGAFTSGTYTVELPRLGTVNLIISSITSDGSTATVTHGDTTSARLRAGDVVTISGMATPVGGTYTGDFTVTGTPTSTEFTFTTVTNAATTAPTGATASGTANVFARSGVIATDATAAQVKYALEGPSADYGFGTVSVFAETFDSAPSWGGGYLYTITFTSLGGDVEDLRTLETTMPNGAIDFGTGNAILGTNKDTNALPFGSLGQPIEANIIGGSFKLSFNNTMTGDISVAATDTDVATSLNAIMGVGSVSVSRFHPSGAGSGAGPGPAGGWQWAVTVKSPV